MEPADKHPEVVYRKTPDPEARRVRSALSSLRGYAPALIPLIVGFLLLLGLIFGLGYLSVKRVEDVGGQARDLGLERSLKLSLLLELRLKVTRLDNEARLRGRVDSQSEEVRRELLPPFEFKLNNARAEVAKALELLERPPLSQEQSWNQLRTELQSYVESTMDVKTYSLKGFERFTAVDKRLNELFVKEDNGRENIIKVVGEIRDRSRRDIIKWIVLALFVGALVAVGTIWQVQRHFRELQHSMFETRRERTFTTQLLEGMVSAVAAIDEEDRIRSANAAFLQIFPNASIGASVLEKLGSDGAMKMLETVTSIRVSKATYHGRMIAQVGEEDKSFDVYSSPLA